MGDLWCPLVETMRVYLVKFYKIQTAELNKDTSAPPPQPGGGGGSYTEWLCAFIAIINTFGSLFKASDTSNVFQVLIKMADIIETVSIIKTLRLAMFWKHLIRYLLH